MNFPIGTIILWSSSVIPDGWQICDGTGGTPNLINKFIMGCTDDGELLNTGGANSHSHTFSSNNTNSAGSHNHSIDITTPESTQIYMSELKLGGPAATISHNHRITATTNTTGSHTHTNGTIGTADNLPPYIKLVYIMRIA